MFQHIFLGLHYNCLTPSCSNSLENTEKQNSKDNLHHSLPKLSISLGQQGTRACSTSYKLQINTYSQNTTTDLVDHVVADHAVDVERMKTAVEDMWKTTSSKRERRKVSSEAAPGFSLFGDNIGKGFHFFISLHLVHTSVQTKIVWQEFLKL